MLLMLDIGKTKVKIDIFPVVTLLLKAFSKAVQYLDM